MVGVEDNGDVDAAIVMRWHSRLVGKNTGPLWKMPWRLLSRARIPQ